MDLVRLKSLGVKYKPEEPLKNYTTFKVGGACRIMLFPESLAELKSAVEASEGNFVVLGGGSNVLVSDSGFDGAVINTSRLARIRVSGSIIEAECGARLGSLIKAAADNSLGGLEFACGIPGTVGGFVAMNGGCFNKCAADAVCYVKTVDGVYNNASSEFGYRKSRYLGGGVIYSVGFKLSSSEPEIIEQKLEHFSSFRRGKQPKGNSCGSVFLNDGYYAGKVIDQAGLKGARVGGAYVSEAHANFILNDGGTASDVYRLIQTIKETVLAKTGISLSEEVRYIGDF